MKTYVLTVSRVFPKTHARSGDPTFFREKIISGLDRDSELVATCFQKPPKKLHTIRANYDLWEKRIEEVNAGEAILSVRYWSGKPYNSKQVEICRLSKIGLQKLDNPTNFVWAEIDGKKFNWEDVAKNDGLSFDDFCEWFKVRQDGPMAIIHFTSFRY